jgi:hypothetical protein
MPTHPGHRDGSRRAPHNLADSLSRSLRILLRLVAIAAFSGSLFIMLNMDAGSKNQGGRLYVAVAAMVALGAADNQYTRLGSRRLAMSGHAAYRRYRLRSFSLLPFASAALVAAALLLP